eukprot:1182225-Prorocentrum_minimum.AAC.2
MCRESGVSRLQVPQGAWNADESVCDGIVCNENRRRLGRRELLLLRSCGYRSPLPLPMAEQILFQRQNTRHFLVAPLFGHHLPRGHAHSNSVGKSE